MRLALLICCVRWCETFDYPGMPVICGGARSNLIRRICPERSVDIIKSAVLDLRTGY